MRNLITGMLVLLLALSWFWFWARPTTPLTTGFGERLETEADTIQVWVSELLTSPDEAYYYELADCWNSTHQKVKIKMSVMAHAGYESKLRVAIAAGQPPDVALGGLSTLETLQYTGKASNLGVPIPEKYFSGGRLEKMGSIVRSAIVRDGAPTLFPIYRYCYGGVILANRRMLAEAGFDDERIRREGWTFEEFLEAARKMTKDLDGDGTPDVWGFGAALVHVTHLFLREFGPGVWGKELTESFFDWDNEAERWNVSHKLEKEHIHQTVLLLHRMFHEEAVWNPLYLGMDWNEILSEIGVHERLGMTFGETPWVVKLRKEIWETEVRQGVREGEPPDLTVVWMPTLNRGDKPVPHAGVMGFSIMKQTPDKGDAHTDNAIRVALFLTHPAHLGRSQLREFRHLPPEPLRFEKIFPELIDNDDPWVAFYNETMDSDIPLVTTPLGLDTPDLDRYHRIRNEFDRWMEKKGVEFLQQVIYGKLTPEEATDLFWEGLRGIPGAVYAETER
jgi:multiple sugar transport system substrate-binding protein